METPGNTLHAPHTYKLDARGKPPSRFTPLTFSQLSPATPTALVHYLCSRHNHTHTHTHSHPASTLLFPIAPQPRPCYCYKLWQERQQRGDSRFIPTCGCIILLNSCLLNFRAQDKGRITHWLRDSEVILKSREGDYWKSLRPDMQLEYEQAVVEYLLWSVDCMQSRTMW